MEHLKQWFVFIMTTITVLVIFLVADTILMGLITLIIAIFSKDTAMQVFKYGMMILFGIEFLFSIPAVIKSRNKGDKE